MQREEIERLKRIDLIAFLENMGFRPHWRRGDKAMFFSPLREEKSPSFYVQYSDRGWFWKDWGTGESGDIINFVELYYGINFTEAVERLGASSPAYFTPYNPESHSLQTGDEGNFKSKDKEKPRPLGWGYTGLTPSIDNRRCDSRKDSVDWVREFYRKGILMNLNKIEIVRSYFLRNGVRYHSDMKCIPVNDRKENRSYIGIPVPFPLKMRGLELRQIDGDLRKTWGRKTLWLLKRDPRRILIAESVLDALSGEILLGDETIMLCSLNGVCNVSQLEDLFIQYEPKEVILALDADEAGQRATQEALEIAKRHSVAVIEFTGHIDVGVKDLHKLLLYKEELRYGANKMPEVQRTSLPPVDRCILSGRI
jgi:hypothetical protein